jgi:hypothetical protein
VAGKVRVVVASNWIRNIDKSPAIRYEHIVNIGKSGCV